MVAQILPKELVPGMLDFYNNYKKALLGSGVPDADEAMVASVMSAIADRHAQAMLPLLLVSLLCQHLRS